MAVDYVPGGEFGSLLRLYRTVACLTQEEVARRSGVSVRALSDMERGRTSRPLSRSVRLLADALDLDTRTRARLLAAVHGDMRETETPGSADSRVGQSPGLVVPRQLPAPVRDFAGRSAELRALTGLLDQGTADGALVVTAIGGGAGTGKTALAVHWAHLMADRFPDGQLYADLRGADPDRNPAPPAEALCGFLDALGVAPDRLPAGLDAQAALYRSLLARRRVLVVADNARDERQVRPLLPGGGGNLVVVTSRSHLAGLVAFEGARHLSLGSLSYAEAWRMLAVRLGAGRLAAEPRAAAELIVLCERLPLELAVAAARAAVSPGVLLAELAADLREARTSLGTRATSAAQGLATAATDNVSGPPRAGPEPRGALQLDDRSGRIGRPIRRCPDRRMSE